MNSLPNIEFYINDGHASHTYLPGFNIQQQCSNAIEYLNCFNGRRSYHSDYLRLLANRSVERLETCHEWVIQLINGHDHEILLNFTDGARCGARAKIEQVAGAVKKYNSIDMCLGSIPVLLGCANRLKVVLEEKFDALGSMYVCQTLEEWNPDSDPIGILAFEMGDSVDVHSEMVLDAMQLMYFHEVAHLLLGHPYFRIFGQPSHPDFYRYWRAAESEADIAAGWLFCAFNLGVCGADKISSQEESQRPVLDRLMLAGICNYISLQISDSQKETQGKRYYLPSTRLQCLLATANFGESKFLNGTEVTSFSQLFARYYYHTELAFSLYVPGWVPNYSSEAIEDRAEFESEYARTVQDIQVATAVHRKFDWTIT